MLSSLVAVRIGAAGSVWDGYESGSAIGRGTKWSVAGEAVWCVGAAGLWNGASARPLAGLTAERKRPDGKGRQTASPP